MTKPWAILTRAASTAVLRECGYEVKDMTSPEVLWNADNWHLFICQHCDNRATSPNGMNKVALKIADTMDALRASVALERTAGREERQRIHNLRVTLSSIFTLAQDAPASPKTMKAIRVAAKRALDRDHQSAAPSPDDQRADSSEGYDPATMPRDATPTSRKKLPDDQR